MSKKVAIISYMTKVGVGASATAPGFDTAMRIT